MKVIAVHTPEFDFEKKRQQVEKVATRYNKTHAIFMDNDYQYWKALGNRYWPSFYLFDQNGKFVHRSIGEMHEGGEPAIEFEDAITALISR